MNESEIRKLRVVMITSHGEINHEKKVQEVLNRLDRHTCEIVSVALATNEDHTMTQIIYRGPHQFLPVPVKECA